MLIKIEIKSVMEISKSWPMRMGRMIDSLKVDGQTRSANHARRGAHATHTVYGELQKLAKAETHIVVKLNIGVDGDSTRIRLYRRAL